MKTRVHTLLVIASASLLASCAPTVVRPYTPQRLPGQGSSVQLLQDEVQGHGVSFTVIASAGIYKPVFENDDYIFYRGGPVIIKHALGTEDLAGGLALSKRRIGQAFIYETDKKGEPSVLNRRVRAPMLIKP